MEKNLSVQKIIEKYEKKEQELGNKILELKKISVNEEEFDEKTLNKINKIIEKLEDGKLKINSKIEIIKKKIEKGEPIASENTGIINSFFSGNYQFSLKKNKKISNGIDTLQTLSDSLIMNDKSINSLKQHINGRIKSLQAKQGRIEGKQKFLLNWVVKKELKECTSELKKTEKITSKIVKCNQKQEVNQEKLNNLKEVKSELQEFRDSLIASDLIENRLRLKTWLSEKMTDSRIKKLQLKTGLFKYRNKHLIKKNIKFSLINKMKNRVAIIKYSLKSGFESFGDYYHQQSELLKNKQR